MGRWGWVCGLATIVASAAWAETAFLASSKMSEAHRDAVSVSGVVLIESVADARADVRARDLRRARRELRQAQRLCHHIAQESAPLQLQHGIAELRDDLRGGAVSPGRITPIYQHLDRYRLVTDASAVRAHVDRARAGLEGGSVEVAVTHLEQAIEVIAYFEVDLPIDETCRLLVVAGDDLGRGDAQMADTRLRKIQGSLQTVAAIASLEVDEAEFLHVDVDVAAPGD